MGGAHARKSDPKTSHAAAARVRGLTTTQYFIMEIFEMNEGLTDDELIAAYNHSYRLVHPASDASIRSRRAELVYALQLRDTGVRRPSKYGEPATVWDIYGRLF